MAIWKNIEIENERGERVQASAPLIVSASRSTDIPAFYSDWFFNRLDKGYSVWRNPFNNKNSYISYQNCRFIVFWSKNPKPLLGKLDKLKEKGINCYIQYTLNDYEYEMLEQGVPSLDERIETFKELSNKLGKDSVIWRFDPLMLTSRISVVNLIEKIINIGSRIHEYTNKLVFSFSDIGVYDKVKRNLSNYGVDYREWTTDDMKAFAKSLQMVNEQLGWNLELATCSEKIDFDEYGIKHNSCVDDVLITKIAYKDKELMDFLGMEIHKRGDSLLGDDVDEIPIGAIDLADGYYAIRTKGNRDGGQRKLCGCIYSKDIGEYNTCVHLCKYCYANTNNDVAIANDKRHMLNTCAETITGEIYE